MGADTVAASQGSLDNRFSSHSHLCCFQFSQSVDRRPFAPLVDRIQTMQSRLQAFFAAQDATITSHQLSDLLTIFSRCLFSHRDSQIVSQLCRTLS